MGTVNEGNVYAGESHSLRMIEVEEAKGVADLWGAVDVKEGETIY